MAGLEELYPFLGGGRADSAALIEEVRRSTLEKSREIGQLRAETWRRSGDALLRAARLTAGAFRGGGKLLAFGNGGSATDARDLVDDLIAPPVPGWRPLPAIDLTRDAAMLTAIGNDVGVEKTFIRQVIAHGAPGDIAVGFSTSGESGNVVAALDEARRRGMATIGFAGGAGGRMAAPGFVDAFVLVPSNYIPRIQEAHATAYHILLHLVHDLLGEGA